VTSHVKPRARVSCENNDSSDKLPVLDHFRFRHAPFDYLKVDQKEIKLVMVDLKKIKFTKCSIMFKAYCEGGDGRGCKHLKISEGVDLGLVLVGLQG